MKKMIAVLLAILLCLTGCASPAYVDITPPLQSIEKVVIQRTEVTDGKYTYFEKILSESADIEAFCSSLDALRFEQNDAIQYNSCDYLIIFEGPSSKKIIFSGEYAVLNQGTCKFNGKELTKELSSIYQALSQKETEAKPRFLEKQ